MYAWIWRKLPFDGVVGKLLTSLVLITGILALFWFIVFPWAEPLLPFDDVQVTQDGGVPGAPGGAGVDDPGVGTPDPRESGLGDHDLPYSTATDNPLPR
ncbi:hypothetical protein [Asanoa iriomotensis]|uniref:Oligopeptide transport permease C-like N-terminal domain-containing protein n=1 Tax=Asanoa iriomotensis TaxID=234613 RepID=A0ABQ4C735_9ACTN|nr:hypothetical protein [Asanoa iriomotensis]GIF58580.1 hypothetical protein Air01nite_46750 [Asanoa iriomotensis]